MQNEKPKGMLVMRIAMLDDDPQDRAQLTEYLLRFQQERGMEMELRPYQAGLDLLEELDRGFDVIFLDIEMPGMDGMEVAAEIRKTDETVGIIFLTNMGQYAIHGYEVNAIDFMVKPISYFNFARKLERAISFVKKRAERVLTINDGENIVRVFASELYYMEKTGHNVCYHSKHGNLTQRGTIQAVRETLKGLPFSECTSGCLINLRYVERIGRDSVVVNGETLPLSRRMKKDFTRDYLDYYGG